MKLKHTFLGLFVLSTIFYVAWLLGYQGISDMVELERQTYSIMANIKLLIAVAFYIAWRLTP